MDLIDDFALDESLKELISFVDRYEFQSMEDEYIAQIEKLKADLSSKKQKEIVVYIHLLNKNIKNLTSKIVKRFSPYNKHLTKAYLRNLIETDRILLAELYYTSKSDDSQQYLLAKEQYALEYHHLLLSFPEVCKLSVKYQKELYALSMHNAELSFLFHQPRTTIQRYLQTDTISPK